MRSVTAKFLLSVIKKEGGKVLARYGTRKIEYKNISPMPGEHPIR